MLQFSNKTILALRQQLGFGPKSKAAATAGARSEAMSDDMSDDMAEDDGYVPFNIRFKAWWDGVEPADILIRGGDELDRTSDPRMSLVIDENASDDEAVVEDQSRLDYWQALWGEGFSIPGGEVYALEMAKACELEPGMEVLDLTAGLGGSSHAIARSMEVSVRSMESDPELARLGTALAKLRDPEKDTMIEHYTIGGTLTLPKSHYDGIFARELFCFIGEKKEFITSLRDALKVKGHLAFTDFVFADDEAPSEEAFQWKKAEGREVWPWTLDRYRKAMSELSLEVQVFQDMTNHYTHTVLSTWNTFVRNLDKTQVTRSFANYMLVDAELWRHRIQALQSGQLRVLRVHACRRETATMSEW